MQGQAMKRTRMVMSTRASTESNTVEPSADATLESVRELLFGRQVRHLEQELTQQANSAAVRLEASQASSRQQMDAIQARCEHQFNLLFDRIALLEQALASQHQLLHETKAGRTDLAQLFSELAGRLDPPVSETDVVAIRLDHQHGHLARNASVSHRARPTAADAAWLNSGGAVAAVGTSG